MIETKESREEFQKRREKAREAMKAAIRGELPFSDENLSVSVTEAERVSKTGIQVQETEIPSRREDSCGAQTLCPVCEERKRKSRERVKRYREKGK